MSNHEFSQQLVDFDARDLSASSFNSILAIITIKMSKPRVFADILVDVFVSVVLSARFSRLSVRNRAYLPEAALRAPTFIITKNWKLLTKFSQLLP